MGSWTVTGSFNSASWNLYNAMVKSHASNHHPFLSMAVAPDEKNSSTYIIGVSTVKFLNFRTPENFAVIYLKLKKRGQTFWVFRQKDAIGIANSGDPDQTAPLGAV